ncbi:hypothetical protein [Sporomusa ovata]|uniref:Uncharacterized protein n=1 Tax=Sporomusa ovata TaxID=2378 RepID=A0A0U1KUS5_9FIRM|nr:hypothetical protein [Sporomusa ovata]CQR70444.1 hypothetical protein SpAn4DRAFT_1413 [Sporomusa ovata]
MKKIIFLAHDPGGYDVVFPVAENFQRESCAADFYCIGPAANLNPLYKITPDELLKKIKYQLDYRKITGLVTGTSWGSYAELQAIAACKQAGVPTVAILDYWSNYKTRFVCSSGETIYPDYYIVMDQLAREEAIQDGIPQTIIKVLGHPGLDKYITKQISTNNPGRDFKKALFLSQPLSALYGEKLGYTEQQALYDCANVLTRHNCVLHVKFHPKDEVSFQQCYAEMAVSGNLFDIIPEYDLIIGMSTMGLLHAVLMGVPAISYQPNLRESDMCITNKLGLTKCANSLQELELQLALMSSHDINSCNELSQKLIWLDGHSTNRVAAFIREVFI